MASLTWGGISLYSSPPTWDYTYTSSASLTVTPLSAAAGLNSQTVAASLTVNATTTAVVTVRQTISGSLTVTASSSASAFQGQVASANLTITPTVTGQGTTPGTISPITISGVTITPTTPINITYWASWSTWGQPFTYGQNVGSATITPTPVGV